MRGETKTDQIRSSSSVLFSRLVGCCGDLLSYDALVRRLGHLVAGVDDESGSERLPDQQEGVPGRIEHNIL